MTKKAIAYVRISTKDQSNFSIEGQENYIREYALRNNIEIMELFKDEGRSAKSFDRPDWRHLEYFIKKYHHEIDYLIVVKYDRFSRNAAEGLQKIELIEKKYQIIIVSVFEEMFIDYDSPYFFKQRADMLVNAEFELHVIRDRTKFGNHQARKSGRHITNAPWGYVNRRDAQNKPIIVLVPEREGVIRRVFELYLAGTSFKMILKEVKQFGFNLSGRSAIQSMLSNPIYGGLIFVPAYRKEPEQYVKGLHKGVIPEHDWWRVQQMLGNGPKKRSQPHEEVPLRGELLCHCNNAFTAGNSRSKSGRYYWYYKCSLHPKTNLSAINLHNQFDEVLENMSLKAEHVTYLYTTAEKLMTEKLLERKGSAKQLTRELQAAQDKLHSVEEKYITGSLGQEAFTKWNSKLSGEIASLRHRIRDLETTSSAKWDLFRANLHKLTNLKAVYHAASLIQKHIFLRQVFNYSLQYVNGFYRTPYIHPLLSHNALILRNKGLLIYDPQGEETEENVRSTRDGS